MLVEVARGRSRLQVELRDVRRTRPLAEFWGEELASEACGVVPTSIITKVCSKHFKKRGLARDISRNLFVFPFSSIATFSLIDYHVWTAIWMIMEQMELFMDNWTDNTDKYMLSFDLWPTCTLLSHLNRLIHYLRSQIILLKDLDFLYPKNILMGISVPRRNCALKIILGCPYWLNFYLFYEGLVVQHTKGNSAYSESLLTIQKRGRK